MKPAYSQIFGRHGATLTQAIGFGWLVIAYHVVYGFYFPLPTDLMGHDYSFNLPAYLDGYYWFLNNGFLEPPWFTPSFCGGQVFFADPQSTFYSLPQFLVFVGLSPLEASYASVLIFAVSGYWGMFVLLQRRFKCSSYASMLGATLFMFNGFFAARMLIGHITFQSFMLLPAIAALILSPWQARKGLHTQLPSILAGALIAYCYQSGLTSLMIPGGLAVIALCLLASVNGQAKPKEWLIRGTIGGAVALALCASKIVAGLAMMHHFPRTQYTLPGFEGLGNVLNAILHSLFYTSDLAALFIGELWRNGSQMPHEVAAGLSPIPVFVIAITAVFHWRDWLTSPVRSASPILFWLCLAALGLILMVPVGILYYSPTWNAFLKSLPIFASTTSPFRWVLIYIPFVLALTAICANSNPRIAKFGALVAILIVPALSYIEDRTYYFKQQYDPTPIEQAYRSSRKSDFKPQITGNATIISESGHATIDNSLISKGKSSLFCYNPLYGYGLENYQLDPLTVGSRNTITAPGIFNMRNPVCLIYPKENNCKLWDAFRVDDQDRMDAFANYRPISWNRSTAQKIADGTSIIALFFLAGFLLASIIKRLIRPS